MVKPITLSVDGITDILLLPTIDETFPDERIEEQVYMTGFHEKEVIRIFMKVYYETLEQIADKVLSFYMSINVRLVNDKFKLTPNQQRYGIERTWKDVVYKSLDLIKGVELIDAFPTARDFNYSWRDIFNRILDINIRLEFSFLSEIEEILDKLKSKNDAVRRWAVDALGKMGDSRVIEPLIKSLKDKDEVIRTIVVSSLGRLSDKRAVKPLIKALKDKSWMVREEAALALGVIGDKSAIPALEQALEDEEELVRKAADQALDFVRIVLPDKCPFCGAKIAEKKVDEEFNLGLMAIYRCSSWVSETGDSYNACIR